MSLTKKREKQNLKGVDLGFHLENMELWDIQLAEADNVHRSGERGRRNKDVEVSSSGDFKLYVTHRGKTEQDEKEIKDETPQNINF